MGGVLCEKIITFLLQADLHIPIYKSGNRAEAINYRPIALTSHIIKIYERYLREVMVKFIEHNELLCNSQHGFVSGKSCLIKALSY